ncbi:MAG: hypothetical protein ABI862_02930 [Ilumatobacteraceae bacterium]
MGTTRSRRFSVWIVGSVVAAAGLFAVVRHVTGDAAVVERRAPVAVRPLPAGSVLVADGGSGAVDSSRTVPVVVAAGPFDDEWGVPTGYLRSKQGAQAAAVGWVGALGPLMLMGPIAVRDALRELLTAAAAEPTIDGFRAERQRFKDTFGADPLLGIWIESPLQVDLVEFAPDRAVVKVWSQLLMGAASNGVQVLWRTQSVALRWERDDWRVDSVIRVEGPTPVASPTMLPSPGSDFAVLAGWTPAVLAGSSVKEQR